MSHKTVVAGVGMIPFVKPGTGGHYDEMGAEATRLALADAGLDYGLVQQAYVGWVFADSASGNRALYRVGMTGIPVFNVNNNCSSGSNALFLARQAVSSGAIDCALALGFEEMRPGALGDIFTDRPSALGRFTEIANRKFAGAEEIPQAIRLFAGAGYEYQQKYGAKTETFARIREKASHHAVHNERAIFRKPLTWQEVMASPPLFLNVTRLQACPPTSGAAAAVVCSEAFARKHGVRGGVVILGQGMATDFPGTFADDDMMKVVGSEMGRVAAQQAYVQASIGPEEAQVVELHDCYTTNELISYEALGLCGEGEAEKFVLDGDNTYGGRFVTNPSGGLLSKGHPLGATGLAQCAELVWQLRGACGPRQVEGARVAIQHNLGLGGAAVVTIYGKA